MGLLFVPCVIPISLLLLIPQASRVNCASPIRYTEQLKALIRPHPTRVSAPSSLKWNTHFAQLVGLALKVLIYQNQGIINEIPEFSENNTEQELSGPNKEMELRGNIQKKSDSSLEKNYCDAAKQLECGKRVVRQALYTSMRSMCAGLQQEPRSFTQMGTQSSQKLRNFIENSLHILEMIVHSEVLRFDTPYVPIELCTINYTTNYSSPFTHEITTNSLIVHHVKISTTSMIPVICIPNPLVIVSALICMAFLLLLYVSVGRVNATTRRRNLRGASPGEESNAGEMEGVKTEIPH